MDKEVLAVSTMLFKVEGEAKSIRTDLKSRHHTWVIDEPEERVNCNEKNTPLGLFTLGSVLFRSDFHFWP